MTASCPGFATYGLLSNGQVEVSGSIPTFSESQRIDPLLTAWERFGPDIVTASGKHGIPVPWLVGIMMAESKGNPRACSPCSICRAELCATGSGMRCCAFGLMQFIEPTARHFGLTPTQMVESPALAIDAAAKLMRNLSEDVTDFDIVRIAAAYNGGFNRCGKEGTTFGWKTNGDYPMVVVKYANTFVDLNLPVPIRNSAIGTFLAVAGVGLAVAIYLGKIG